MLAQLDRRDEAIAEAEHLSHDFPDDTTMGMGRARLLASFGRKADALAACDALVATHPDDEEIRFTRAMVRKQLGDRDGALADLGIVLERRPNADMLINRAQIWLISERVHWSADLDRAAALGASPEMVFKTRAVLEARAGDYPAATTALTAAERLKPDDPQLFEIRIDLLRRQGKGELALAAIETRAGSAPINASTLNTLCWTKATMNLHLASAVADCDAALKLQPNVPAYLDSRGFAHFRLTDYAAAITDYDAALARRPNQPTSLYGRALAKMKSGKDGTDDLAAARRLAPTIDTQFASYGISP